MQKLICLAIALVIGFQLSAQSMRAPSSSEKKVLMRVIDPINEDIQLYFGAHWIIKDGFEEEYMDVTNGSKSQLCSAYLVTLKLSEDAPIYKKSMEKMNRFLKEEKQDSIVEAYAELEKNSVIHMDIEINSASVDLGSMPNKNISIKVPGTSKAFIVAQDNNDPDNEGTVVLAFGHWKDARLDSENNCYRFKYHHPPQTPFIENVLISIHGNSGRIKEILMKSDWQNVAAPLDE